jgi:hypothetical protein
MEWANAPGNAPFVIALLVMIGLAVVEMIALFTGFSLNDMVDEFIVPHSGVETLGNAPTGMEATGADAPGLIGRFLAWLYIGKIPVLMVLIVLLTVFGLTGLIAQEILRGTIGFTAPGILAAPAVLVASLPIVRICTAGIARILPRDESSAVDPASFIGRTARVISGVARVGLPAEARLRDVFGTDHHVIVEPEDTGESFPTGSIVLLVRQTGGGRFAAIANPNQILVDRE